LFESADGKDQESSSEDAFFAYAVKMWGKTVEDLGMELRGNLMLSILARTLRHYYLMEESNRNQPPRFIGNKVAGIVSCSCRSPRRAGRTMGAANGSTYYANGAHPAL
jgi:endo-1,3(4)-beta-glucanase